MSIDMMGDGFADKLLSTQKPSSERAGIEQWLRNKRTALWGRSFAITKDDEIERAVDFIERELADLIAFLDTPGEPKVVVMNGRDDYIVLQEPADPNDGVWLVVKTERP